MTTSSYTRRIGACMTVLTAVGLAACKSNSDGSAPAVVAQTIVVVGEDNPQSQVLTEIYAQALEHGGFRVARRDNVADLAAGYASLKNGAADLFVTHTGELLAYTSANEPAAANTSTTAEPTTTEAPSTTGPGLETSTTVAVPLTTAPQTTSTTKSTATTIAGTSGTTATTTGSTESTVDLANTTTTTISTVGQAAAVSINGQTKLIGEILPDSLQIGAASDAEDKSVIACTNGVSTTGYLSTLTDLAKTSQVLRIAGPAAFKTGDPFGLPGFESKYGGTFKQFVEVAADKVGAALTPPKSAADSTTTVVGESTTTAVDATTTTVAAAETAADCGAFNSLDVTMPGDAVEMDDDQNWIETNGVIPLLSATSFTPGVSQLVDKVSQTLKTVDLRAMLVKVETQNVTPAAMASQYVNAAGLAK